jgi:hypothetical protein
MVYSDIVKNDLILPRKEKYTIKDFEKLVKAGTEPKQARFICICSAIFHDTKYSKVFNSLKMRVNCNIL